MPSEYPETVRSRHGFLNIWRRADVPIDRLLSLLAESGEVLKRNAKSQTRRIGTVIAKSSEGNLIVQTARHTAQRARYRRGWHAALHLAAHNIPAPRPLAHVEWSLAGIIVRHVTILEYLPDCVDVERFADTLLAGVDGERQLHDFLARLAAAVNAFVASGAVHTDLAGKNILTRDGIVFYFIDLDGVVLHAPYTDEKRLLALVQLYDSFLDRCGDAHLTPFLAAMLPEGASIDSWLPRVKADQAVRRARTVAAWEREGKTAS